jgi:stage V sporulation protein S
MPIIKVASTSQPQSTGSAIARVVQAEGTAEVQAIGVGAVNQAVKALAVAHRHLHKAKLATAVVPGFVDLELAGRERTALCFRVVVLVRR